MAHDAGGNMLFSILHCPAVYKYYTVCYELAVCYERVSGFAISGAFVRGYRNSLIVSLALTTEDKQGACAL